MRIINFFNPFGIFDLMLPLTLNTMVVTDSNNHVTQYKKKSTTINNGVKSTSYVNLTKKDNKKDYNLNTKRTINGKVVSEESKVISNSEAENIINEKFNTNNLINFGQSLNNAILDINNCMNIFSRMFKNTFWW